MRTLHNTIINPTYWNKAHLRCGTAVLSIPEDKCYLPTLTEKVSHPTCKKIRIHLREIQSIIRSR
ncbi:MAG: hypothetical protein HWD63_16050 [Candidatus Parvibacillus calidus]|nr:MAG: hypothetical protein HWD63_16050 [Candidatus Parvibacillus calidus]